MKTTIKYPKETVALVSFTLDKKDLSEAKDVALHKLAKNLKVAGFRKGKVPISVAAKNVNPAELDEETVEAAISKAVSKAFVDEKIQALDRPSVELKKYVPAETLEFTAEAEVLPQITLGDYTKLKVNIDAKTTGEAEIDDVLERMRQGFAETVAVEREVKEGDETIIDFIGKKDGVAFEGGSGNDYHLTIGSNTFIPGFEEGIVGKKAGETFDLQLKFPLDYHVEDLKGAGVVFTTTLKTVNQKSLPELNDEFAKKAGPFKTMDELRADIKRELGEQSQREALDKTKDALVAELVAVSKVPVPEVLIKDQTESIRQDFMQNLMYQGLTVEQYVKSQGFKDEAEWEDKELKPAAEKRVKAGLVLSELSKAEKIEATSEELAEFINKYRMSYASNPEIVKQFDDPSVQRELANRLLTEKTVDRLVEINSK